MIKKKNTLTQQNRRARYQHGMGKHTPAAKNKLSLGTRGARTTQHTWRVHKAPHPCVEQVSSRCLDTRSVDAGQGEGSYGRHDAAR